MKKITLLIVLLIIIELANGQATFQRTFGGIYDDGGFSAQQTSDGGYIITGFVNSLSPSSLSEIYLVKLNSFGDTLWTKTFGGTVDDFGSSIQQTTDGGYIIAGSTRSFGAGGNDVYLVKTDLNGNLVWSKTFGGIYDDMGSFVQQTSDGGYILTGSTETFLGSNGDVYLIKTDANGDSLWTKSFSGINVGSGNCVIQTSDGGYIVVGYTGTSPSFYSDVYLLKTDANGNLLWAKTFGGNGWEKGYSVQQTTDEGYIIAGYSNTGGNIYKTYLIKADSTGNLLWSKTYGNFSGSYGYSVEQTTDGGFIIAGQIYHLASDFDVYLIKTDANGDSLWTKTFGGSGYEIATSVHVTNDGGYIICGWSTSFSAGFHDVYVIKTDAFGNSGCNEGMPVTNINTPATVVFNITPNVTSPPIIVTTLTTAAGSTAIISTSCVTVGIAEIINDNSIFISPNPSDGKLSISFEEPIIEGNLEILNILGKNIFSEKINNALKKEINLKNISNGIYVVKVVDGDKSYCKKLIIKHD